MIMSTFLFMNNNNFTFKHAAEHILFEIPFLDLARIIILKLFTKKENKKVK